MVAEDCGAFDSCNPPVQCSGQMTYIQPPMAVSCKPAVMYQRSTAPIESDTVYKTSFYPVNPAGCRMAPVVPVSNICVDPSIRMDNETVTQLSYPCPGRSERAKAIRPCTQPLFAPGPLQDLTTQKHDYVPKCIKRRRLIKPKGMMQLTPLPLDCETVQKLSFPPPCNVVPTLSFKPVTIYRKPCEPMDTDTTHQLSYSPVCPPAKEIFPWAQRPAYKMPCVPIENETTYKLSFLGGNVARDPLVLPKNNKCMITCDVSFDDRTVYKDSFLCNPPNCCRSEPIRPIPNLYVNPDIKMDPETMYNLAYQGHFCVPRRRPIVPCMQPMRGGPMQDLTTQKHDYVCKPICRRKPFKPKNMMIAASLPLDCQTTANTSYMCPCPTSPSISFKPVNIYKRPCVPMDVDTTQKLSFQPVCTPKKEYYDWAMRPKYRMPELPMDTDTVQKLSYAAPGRFVSGGGDTCCIPPVSAQFPRAGCC